MNFPFQNPDLPLEQRVSDLVSRLTLDEKIELMCQYQAEIPRLGVHKYKHGTEGAHGVAWLGEATVFPQNTGLACTWNPELMQRIGSVMKPAYTTSVTEPLMDSPSGHPQWIWSAKQGLQSLPLSSQQNRCFQLRAPVFVISLFQHAG